MPYSGESQEAFAARFKAEEVARERYTNASEEERAAIDQARLWENYPAIFLARVEKVKIHGRIYGTDAARPARQKYVSRHGRAIPVPPQPIEPVPVTLEGHQAYLRPVAPIKGELGLSASWQDVGGWNSCGTVEDGDLTWAIPGDYIVVFANEVSIFQFHLSEKKMIESKRLRLFGILRTDVVDPRLLEALRSIDIGTGPTWDAAH